MVKIKTAEATSPALDWLVATIEGREVWVCLPNDSQHVVRVGSISNSYSPSTDWAQGGPIIEREHIGVSYYTEADDWEVPNWGAWRTDIDDRQVLMGETALIAAMRAFVVSKMGNGVEVPEELL